jgi:hypothetical protein
MTGIVLALAGLTCGDGGPGAGAAREPVVGPMVFRLRTGWELKVHADPMRYLCEMDPDRNKLYLVERGTRQVLLAAYAAPDRVTLRGPVPFFTFDMRQRGRYSFEHDGSFRYSPEPGGKPVFLSARLAEPRKP